MKKVIIATRRATGQVFLVVVEEGEDLRKSWYLNDVGQLNGSGALDRYEVVEFPWSEDRAEALDRFLRTHEGSTEWMGALIKEAARYPLPW